jgi:hypothetical protein
MIFEETFDAWLRDRGDDLLREADLNRNSLVVDVGAYEGKWLLDMNKRYGCRCIGFEPLNFGEIEGVTLIRKALSTKNGSEKISLEGDASSIGEGETAIETIDAADFFGEEIDILQINIEGHEYALLPYLLEKNLLTRVERLQVQFHREKPGSEKMGEIISSLEKAGFTTKFHYENIWWCGSREAF